VAHVAAGREHAAHEGVVRLHIGHMQNHEKIKAAGHKIALQHFWLGQNARLKGIRSLFALVMQANVDKGIHAVAQRQWIHHADIMRNHALLTQCTDTPQQRWLADMHRIGQRLGRALVIGLQQVEQFAVDLVELDLGHGGIGQCKAAIIMHPGHLYRWSIALSQPLTPPPTPPRHLQTELIHATLQGTPAQAFHGLASPVYRASTVLFDNAQAYSKRHEERGWTYGTIGTPTTALLEQQVNRVEGGVDTCLAASGLGAVTLAYLALLNTGDHVLVPDNVYDPSRNFAKGFCQRMGIEHSFYDPMDLAALPALFKPNTKLVWVETPGSNTFEVSDLPAIAALAHARGARVAVDNTYSGGVYLKALALGADVSVQALTKYHGGHGDLVLGSVTSATAALARQVRSTREALGISVSGDDCYLVLRGMQTMHLRLAHVQAGAYALAQWLKQQPQVEQVLHPALPDCPGHTIWQRDFTGASSVFGFVLRAGTTAAQADAWVDALQLFRIGASWGGTTSLALHMSPHKTRSLPPWPQERQLIRLNVGLEHVDDLIADAAQAFQQVQI
jgi:cysteine-S-conjugate beta-lyase